MRLKVGQVALYSMFCHQAVTSRDRIANSDYPCCRKTVTEHCEQPTNDLARSPSANGRERPSIRASMSPSAADSLHTKRKGARSEFNCDCIGDQHTP